MNLTVAASNTVGNTRGDSGATGPRAATAVIIGLLAFGLVLGLDAIGWLSGPTAVLLGLAAWLFTPSARRLSLRLALNGAIALGLIPVLWWFPWQLAAVSHSGLILGVLVGHLSFRLMLSRKSRRTLLPVTSITDILPAATALICVWFFWPFFQFSTGIASISALRNAFGNDNVAHFDMFEMIRRTLTSGPNWPPSATGSPYAYTTYPQHFHILVAFAAELWAGPTVHGTQIEAGLFGIGGALVLTVALVVLVAAGSSFFRKHPPFALIFTAIVVFFLLIGFGGSALSYGFPGYLLAIIGTCIAIALAARRTVVSWLELLSIGATVVLVAHSWSLLAPIAGIAFVVAILKFPWRREPARWRSLIAPTVVCLASLAGVAYAAYLVFWATSSSGSAAAALSTPGSSPTLDLSLSLAPVVVVLVAALVGRLVQSGFTSGEVRRASTLMLAVSLTAAAESACLIEIQFTRAHELSYFQYKFLGAVFLIFAITLAFIACFVLARLTGLHRRAGTSLSVVAVLLFAVAGVTVGSTFQFTRPATIRSLQLGGTSFRAALTLAATHPTASDKRLVKAAHIMAALPCHRPIYIAPLPGDQNLGASNQWALSLSSTWTIDTGSIDARLFPLNTSSSMTNVNPIIRDILAGHSERCVVVAPQTRSALSPQTLQSFESQILSWLPRPGA